jgi:hypothetical protein
MLIADSVNVNYLDTSVFVDVEDEILSTWESIDFTVPAGGESLMGRWIEVELELMGSGELDVYQCTDTHSFSLVDTITLSEVFVTTRVPLDIVSRTLRIRLRTSGSFQLRWIRAWVIPGSAR